MGEGMGRKGCPSQCLKHIDALSASIGFRVLRGAIRFLDRPGWAAGSVERPAVLCQSVSTVACGFIFSLARAQRAPRSENYFLHCLLLHHCDPATDRIGFVRRK